MKRNNLHSDEFFVGYLADMPPGISRTVLRLLITAIAAAIAICIAIAVNQRSFSRSTFEYGVNTRITGSLYKYPVPLLSVHFGKTDNGASLSQTILLTGNGKHGALDILQELEKNSSLPEGQTVQISGNLIYGNGRALLQINEKSDIVRLADTKIETAQRKIWEKPSTQLTGEIVDPKCFFGVMKPGEGKLHRSCAIRCISGGIPPVFNTGSDYLVIVGENYQPLNEQVLDVVGDKIQLTGTIVEIDTWKILRVDSKELSRQVALKMKIKNLAALETNITSCGM